MAKDEFVDQKINEFQEVIQEAVINKSRFELHRALRLFAKEVERETRHKAADMVQSLSNDIHNL